MKRNGKTVVITVCVCIAALLAGIAAGYCIGKNSAEDITAAIPREEVSAPPMPSADNKTEQMPVTYVTRSDVSAAKDSPWTTVGTYEGDMTGDGTPDTLTIYTSAQSKDGEMMWDDGQSWLVEVSDSNGGYYALLSQYVNNGSVYAQVSENNNHKTTITLIVTGGAGLNLKRYEYSSSGFMEKRVVDDVESNVLYSSVPLYR